MSRFPELRHEIQDQEAKSREIRQLIQQSKGMERCRYWEDKRHHGCMTRSLLLIYAMLRGKPRAKMETRYRLDHNYWLELSMSHLASQRGLALNRKAIQNWLNGATPAPQVLEAASADESVHG